MVGCHARAHGVSRGNGLGGEGPAGVRGAGRVARLLRLLGRAADRIRAARHRGRRRHGRPGRRRQGGRDAPTGDARRPGRRPLPAGRPAGGAAHDPRRHAARPRRSAAGRVRGRSRPSWLPGLRARASRPARAAGGPRRPRRRCRGRRGAGLVLRPWRAAALRGRRHLLRRGARRHRGHDAARRRPDRPDRRHRRLPRRRRRDHLPHHRLLPAEPRPALALRQPGADRRVGVRPRERLAGPRAAGSRSPERDRACQARRPRRRCAPPRGRVWAAAAAP